MYCKFKQRITTMTEQTQIIMAMLGLLWITIIIIGSFIMKLMLDIKTEMGNIKADISDIKAETRNIVKRLDSLESGITSRR